MSDINTAMMELLMERLEELEERVRVLEIGLDVDAQYPADYDELDYDILPEDDPLD